MSKYARQIDIIDTEKLSFPIHIIGVGGIGSWTALLIAKMGCSNITIYDFDVVEEHNCASQFYKESQLGIDKMDALQENILEQTGINVKRAPIAEEENINEGLIIIAVDSMDERAKLAEMFRDKDVTIIDGRMGGVQLEIYTRHGISYPGCIVPSEDVSHEPCTAKAISFNCAVIGGLICNFVRHYANDNLDKQDLIFEFNNLMMIKTT